MPSTVIYTIGATVITTGTIAAFAAKIALSFAINALLSKRSDSARAANPVALLEAQTVSTVESAASHEMVFGTVRKGGVLTFRDVAPLYDGNGISENHQVPLTPLPYYGIQVNLAAGYLSNISVQGYVSGGPDEDPVLTTYTQVAGDTPGDAEYGLLPGGVYVFNAAQAGQNVIIRYFTSQAAVVGNVLSSIYCFAAHQCEAIDQIYFDDELVTLDSNGYGTGKWAGSLYIAKHLGAPGQAADPVLQSISGKWTSAHRGEGICYLYVQMKREQLLPGPWVAGVPNVSVVMRGTRVFDPRSGLTAFSANAALCLAKYLNSEYGLNAPYGTAFVSEGIAYDRLIAEANICDESVPLSGGGTEARYTINGVVDTALAPREVIGRMLSAMAGRLVRSAGQWQIFAGAYTAPVRTYNEDHIVGSIKTSTLLSMRDSCNGVKGVYLSPVNDWQLADFPPVKSATFMAQDGGLRVWHDIELPFTTSAATAQRLAKIELLRARQEISHQIPMNLAAYRESTGSTLALTLEKYGYSAKPFEIAEMQIDLGLRPTIVVLLRETASNVYDWDASEEQAVDPAPNTSLGNPFVVAAPGVPSVAETLYEHFGFGVRLRGLVNWSPSPDSTVRSYILQWSRRDAGRWFTLSGITGNNAELDNIEAGAYLIRVAAINAIGTTSVWAQTEHTFAGLMAPPGNIADFSVIKAGGFGLAQWALTTDLDVRISGRVEIRHSPLTTGAIWSDGMVIAQFAGNSTSGIVPLVTGTYMAKFLDSSLTPSAAEASFTLTEGGLTGYTTVATSTQHTAFTGAKTNVVLDGGLGGIRIDDVSSGNAQGVYLFDTHLDMTTVATRRFEADIEVLSYAADDMIGSRGLVSTWDDITGVVVNDCDATLYIRMTDDDPAGTPTWGAWAPFVVGEFTGRAAQFKLELDSENATHNILCKTLAVDVKI